MKVFNCTHCGHLLFFENHVCEKCGSAQGFEPDGLKLVCMSPPGQASNLSDWQYCANHQHGTCNWLVPTGAPTDLCPACELNRFIPNIAKREQYEAWQKLESAKHRLIYSLLRFRLPLVSKLDNPSQGLAFDFVSNNEQIPPSASNMTGHAQGQVTITAEEADPAIRVSRREDMDESYRTLLGHFRHEVGHYYWDVLVAGNEPVLSEYRSIFGDERADYGEALKQHYEQGAAVNWQQHYISAYATSHPWEDWAETWAHYFHIVDTLDTASAFNLGLQIPVLNGPGHIFNQQMDPYDCDNFEQIHTGFQSLSVAINSINRSMGQPDLYPFVLNQSVINKLEFIHRLVRQSQI